MDSDKEIKQCASRFTAKSRRIESKPIRSVLISPELHHENGHIIHPNKKDRAAMIFDDVKMMTESIKELHDKVGNDKSKKLYEEAASFLEELKREIENPESEIENSKHDAENPESEIENPKSDTE
jgi:hypothetical protein